MLWVTNQTEGGVSMFDPETEKFTRFPKPDSVPRAGQRANAVDLKGNIWIQLVGGVAKLEPKTGKYTFIPSGQPTTDTYGLTVDKDNNIWFSSPGYDTVWMIDQKNNNKVTTLTVPPLKVNLANDRDKELSATVRHSEAGSTPIQKGPRRMTADPNGNYLWIAEYFSDQLLRIDIHTKEMKEYDLPYRFSQPYTTNVDREHNVWINMLDRDAVAKFNPSTEQFTEIQMPTRGTEIRQTAPDDSTDPVSIWVPYDRTSKIARIQIRSASEMQAQAR
jgi:streptogramin lyase